MTENNKIVSPLDYIESCSPEELTKVYELIHKPWYLKTIVEQLEITQNQIVENIKSNFEFS